MIDREKKYQIYHRSFVSAISKFSTDGTDSSALASTILYGVRFANFHGERIDATSKFQFAQAIMSFMSLITPRELVTIFPIEKTYDGKRWETKDYFTTVEMIAEHGWDNLISKPFEFIWDYQNWELSVFVVNVMGAMSDIRRSQGKSGIMEEFLAENGVPMYTLHTAPSGRQYLLDGNGKVKPVKKSRPRHLKIVKVGRGKP